MFNIISKDYPQLLVANFNIGQKTTRKRIVVIRHRTSDIDNVWNRVPHTNILLIGGSKTRLALKHFMQNTPSARNVFPGELSGSTDHSLRKYLGILQSQR